MARRQHTDATRRTLHLLGVLAVTLGLTASAHAQRAPTAAEVAERDRVRAEVAAASPAALAALQRGEAADDAGDLDAAAAAYAEAARLAPGPSHPLRRSCGVDSRRLRHEEAVAHCGRALALAEIPANHAAMAWALLERGADADLPTAQRHARSAFNGDPRSFFAAITYARVAVHREDPALLDLAVERMRTIEPTDPYTHVYATYAAMFRGDLDRAARSIEAARASGLPDEAADELLRAVDAQTPLHVRAARAAGWIGAAWLTTLLTLTVLGFALSAATLRAASRLPTEPGGHATGADRALRRAYAVCLWAACAFYYASIPLVLAVITAISGVFVYAVLVFGGGVVKIAGMVGLFFLVTAWAIVKSLLARGRDGDPGMRLDLDAQPKLRAALDEVARAVGTRPPDAVFLVPDASVAVFERGRALSRLLGRRSERCLVLGLGVLPGMTALQLKAVLAHEHGHFKNEDTAGGAFALAVRRSVILTSIELDAAGAAHWYNPAWLFLRGFAALFGRISQGASRLQEILADRWAAFAYGPAAFEAGLRHVIGASVAFDAHADAVLHDVVTHQRPLRNLYGHAPAMPVDGRLVAAAVSEILARPETPYDSHPAPLERFAITRRLGGPSHLDDDGAMAVDLLDGVGELQEAMTRLIKVQFAEGTGFVIPDALPHTPSTAAAFDAIPPAPTVHAASPAP